MDSKHFIKRLCESKLFKDSSWALIGSVLGKGLSLIAGITVARLLGKEIYGEYGMIKSTLINISIFSTLGLGYTGTRFIAKFMQENPSYVLSTINKILRITFCFSSVIFLFVFLFASDIALYLEVPETTNAFRVAAFIILFNAFNTAQTGILAGFKDFRATAINGAIVGVCTFVFSTLLTYFFGLDGSLLALLLSQIIGTLLNAVSINKSKKDLSDQQHYLNGTRDLLSFSIPVALQEFLYTAVVWTSSVFMVKFSSYEEMGLLGAVSQWIAIIAFVPGVLKNVALSHFSSDGNKSLFNRMLQINFAATFVPYIFVVIFSGLITAMYGLKYDGLTIVLIIGTAQPIFTSLSTVIIYEFIARSKTWLMFFVRLIREASNLLLVWIGLHVFNSNGAVVVSTIHVIVAFLFFVVMYIVSKRFLYQKKSTEQVD